jgi:hypothetical protein
MPGQPISSGYVFPGRCSRVPRTCEGHSGRGEGQVVARRALEGSPADPVQRSPKLGARRQQRAKSTARLFTVNDIGDAIMY